MMAYGEYLHLILTSVFDGVSIQLGATDGSSSGKPPLLIEFDAWFASKLGWTLEKNLISRLSGNGTTFPW
jgi:hypothetical protein